MKLKNKLFSFPLSPLVLRFTDVSMPKPEPEHSVDVVSDPSSSDPDDVKVVSVTSKPRVHLFDQGEEKSSNKSNNSDDQLHGVDLKDSRGIKRSAIRLGRPDTRTRSYLALQKFLADDFEIVSRLHSRRHALTGFEQLEENDLRLFDKSYRENAVKETGRLLRLVQAVRRFRKVSNIKRPHKHAPLADSSVQTPTFEQAAVGEAERSRSMDGSQGLRKGLAADTPESLSRPVHKPLVAVPPLPIVVQNDKFEDEDDIDVGLFLNTLVDLQMDLEKNEGRDAGEQSSRTTSPTKDSLSRKRDRKDKSVHDNVRGETDRTNNKHVHDNVRGETDRTDNKSVHDNVRGETDNKSVHDNVRGETDRTDNKSVHDNVRGETDRTDNKPVHDNVRGETDRTDNKHVHDNVRGETDRTDNKHVHDNVRGETDRTDNKPVHDNVRGETDRTDNKPVHDNVRGETDRTDNKPTQRGKDQQHRWPSVPRAPNLACFPRRHEADYSNTHYTDYSNNGSSGQGHGGEVDVQTPFSGLGACVHGGRTGWRRQDSHPPDYVARSVGPIFSLGGEQHDDNLPGYAGRFPDDYTLPGYAGGFPDDYTLPGYAGGFLDDYTLPGYAGGFPDDDTLPGYAGGFPDDYTLPGYAGGFPDDYNLPGYAGGADFSLGLRDRNASSSSTWGLTKRPSQANSGRSNIGMPSAVLANPGLSGCSRRDGRSGYSYNPVRPSCYTLGGCSHNQSRRTSHAVDEESYNQSATPPPADRGSAFSPQGLHKKDELRGRHVDEVGEPSSWSRGFPTSKSRRSTVDTVGLNSARQGGKGQGSLKANSGRRMTGAPCLELPESVQGSGSGRSWRATNHDSVNNRGPVTSSYDDSTDMASSDKESHADSHQQKRHTPSPGQYLDTLDEDPYHFELNNKITAAVKALCNARRERQLNTTPDTRRERLLNITSDTRREALRDTTPDTRREGVMDITPDTRRERLLNTTPDTRREGLMDITPDTRRERLLNTTPDTRREGVMDTTPDTRREGVMDTTPETLVRPFSPQRSASSASEEEGEGIASLSPRSSLTSVVTSTTASETSYEAERDAVRGFERSNQVLLQRVMLECERRWYYDLTNNFSTSPLFRSSERFAFTTGVRVVDDSTDMLTSVDSTDTSASSGWDDDKTSNK
ncbi:uncharacterized protein [Littorina saxatilis]|uniref:uncharacterized protein n=1 Tax=Littorina saxatilis TaxID=31220 RepID=UPI0038B63C25